MYRFLLIFMSLFVILAGCQTKPEEKIYNILEETVSQEKGFQNQQAPLAKLEQQETNLFKEIMDLGMKDFPKVEQLSDKALQNIKEREERMNKEQESMLSSKKEFMKIKNVMSELKDPKLNSEAKELYNIMLNRYETHEKLYKAYVAGLGADKKLYEMLKHKNVQLNDLEKQIKATNDSFTQVMKANKEFNSDTKTYNEKKLSFYGHAGIEKKS